MKKNLFIISFIVYAFLFSICKAQPVQQEWVRRYPDTNTFQAGSYALALDDSSNVYVTGFDDYGNNPPFLGYCTIKYSSAGKQKWVANYNPLNGTGRYASDITVDKSTTGGSNVYVTGYCYGNYFDYCTIKYNSNGVQQWVQYYDGLSHGLDQAQKIAVDNAGNIYVTGFSAAAGGLSLQIATVKYSTDGRELWVQRYGTPFGDTYSNGIVIDDSCNIYITGINYYSAVTIKYDSSGVQQWVGTFGEYQNSAGTNCIALDKFDNVYVTGFSNNIGFPYGHRDYLTIKYTSAGVQEWVKKYNTDTMGNGNFYEARSVVSDNISSIYVGGYFRVNQSSPTRLCTIKYSNLGELLWVQKDTANAVSGFAMDIDHDNNIYLATSFSSLFLFSVVKYDTSGYLKWRQNYYAGGAPKGIKVDWNFNLYLTGAASGKMTTIKYSQITEIKNNTNESINNFKLYQNFPNPFNPSTKIKFSIPPNKGQQHYTTLKIYDILGREVAILVNKELKPGSYEIEWEASNYASGIYFYKLIAGDFSDTKKMILIR